MGKHFKKVFIYLSVLFFMTGCGNKTDFITIDKIGASELESNRGFLEKLVNTQNINSKYKIVNNSSIILLYDYENTSIEILIKIGYGKEPKDLNKITTSAISYIDKIILKSGTLDETKTIETYLAEIIDGVEFETTYDDKDFIIDIDNSKDEARIKKMQKQTEFETKIKNNELTSEEIEQMLKDGTLIGY